MAEYLVQDSTLINIADAIRAKTGKTESIVLSSMADEISTITTGVELNYEVVGGTEVPSNHKENTIWVNTDVEITSWIFSVDEPENPVNGMVWFRTGEYSSVIINVLKDSSVEVYPLSAKQYINNAWVGVTAKSYQDGWKDWFTAAFLNGDTCDILTGGWEAVKRHCGGAAVNGTVGAMIPELTIEDGKMTVKSYMSVASNYYGGTVQTKGTMDMSKFSTITFHVTDIGNDSGGGGLIVGVTSNLNLMYYKTDASVNLTAVGDISIDISAVSGECKIVLCPWTSGAAGKTAYITVDEIRLDV